MRYVSGQASYGLEPQRQAIRPRIDAKAKVCNEVVAALKKRLDHNGIKNKKLQKKITEYCGNQATLCLNSGYRGLRSCSAGSV